MEIGPGGSFDKQVQIALCWNTEAQTHNKCCQCWMMLRGKVCFTVISLPTHVGPGSESDFLVSSVCKTRRAAYRQQRLLHCHLKQQIKKTKTKKHKKQLDHLAGRISVSNMCLHYHYKVSTLTLILCGRSLTSICTLSGPRLSPPRRFRSSSSGWHWRRTSSRSVWRTRWRLDCISKIETKEEGGQINTVNDLKKRLKRMLQRQCKKNAGVQLQSNKLHNQTNAFWAFLLMHRLLHTQISEVKELNIREVPLQQCWVCRLFSADKGLIPIYTCI